MSDQYKTAAGRPAPRKKIFQPMRMIAAGTEARIHLLDVSSSGALAHAETPPPVGTLVRLAGPDCGGMVRIAWVRGKRFGLAFLAPLAPSRVQALLSPERVVSEHRQRSLGTGTGG